MANCNTDSLLADARVFSSIVSPGLYYPAKLALLCQIWQQLSPGADCSVDALLANAACFNCIPNQMLTPLRLQLLCEIAGGGGGSAPNTPTNLDVSNSSTNANTILTWSQPIAPDSNLIERSKDGNPYVQIAMVPGSHTTYTDTDLVPDGSLWRYRVSAQLGVQTSSPSNTVAVASNYNHNNDNLTSINIPDLIICYGDFKTLNETLLTILSVPAMRKVLGNFSTAACSALTTFNAAGLLSTGQVFQVAGCALLTSISVGSLVSVGAAFDCSNSALTSLSLPSFTTCIGDFAIFSSTSLVTVTANALTSITGNLSGTGCTLLTTVAMSNVIYIDGTTIDLSQCALNVTSVDQVLSRGVASGTNSSTYSVNGGTNAGPTNDCNIGSNCATLQNQGNTVNTN